VLSAVKFLHPTGVKDVKEILFSTGCADFTRGYNPTPLPGCPDGRGRPDPGDQIDPLLYRAVDSIKQWPEGQPLFGPEAVAPTVRPGR
jgi:hypothetical protein